MENSSTYKGLDLRKVTMYDIADLYEDKPAIMISPESELTEEQERILELYTYAQNYELTELLNQLQDLYSKELLSIQS